MPKPELQSFHVAVQDVKLTAAQKARLSKEINAAALHQLAQLDIANGLQARVPKEWLGIWIDRIGQGAPKELPSASPATEEAIGQGALASVALQGVKLTAAQQGAIESAVRSAALKELGKLAPSVGVGVRFPKIWNGIWIGPMSKGGK